MKNTHPFAAAGLFVLALLALPLTEASVAPGAQAQPYYAAPPPPGYGPPPGTYAPPPRRPYAQDLAHDAFPFWFSTDLSQRRFYDQHFDQYPLWAQKAFTPAHKR